MTERSVPVTGRQDMHDLQLSWKIALILVISNTCDYASMITHTFVVMLTTCISSASYKHVGHRSRVCDAVRIYTYLSETAAASRAHKCPIRNSHATDHCSVSQSCVHWPPRVLLVLPHKHLLSGHSTLVHTSMLYMYMLT